jgi:hypothetical protein
VDAERLQDLRFSGSGRGIVPSDDRPAHSQFGSAFAPCTQVWIEVIVVVEPVLRKSFRNFNWQRLIAWA